MNPADSRARTHTPPTPGAPPHPPGGEGSISIGGTPNSARCPSHRFSRVTKVPGAPPRAEPVPAAPVEPRSASVERPAVAAQGAPVAATARGAAAGAPGATPPEPRRCEACGVELPPRGARGPLRRTCGARCRKRRCVGTRRDCARCGAPRALVGRNLGRYCGPACKAAADLERRRAYEAAQTAARALARAAASTAPAPAARHVRRAAPPVTKGTHPVKTKPPTAAARPAPARKLRPYPEWTDGFVSLAAAWTACREPALMAAMLDEAGASIDVLVRVAKAIRAAYRAAPFARAEDPAASIRAQVVALVDGILDAATPTADEAARHLEAAEALARDFAEHPPRDVAAWLDRKTRELPDGTTTTDPDASETFTRWVWAIDAAATPLLAVAKGARAGVVGWLNLTIVQLRLGTGLRSALADRIREVLPTPPAGFAEPPAPVTWDGKGGGR